MSRRPRSLRRPTPRRAAPRRALIEEPERRSWLRHGLVGVGVSAVGLAVAASLALTGSATDRHASGSATTPTAGVATGHVPAAFNQRAMITTRDTMRLPLDGETIDPQAGAAAQSAAAKAQQRSGITSTSVSQVSPAAAAKRLAALKSDTSKTRKFARELAADASSTSAATSAATKARSSSTGGSADTSASTRGADKSSDADVQVSLPITTGYSVGARFGQIGVWARYHTGFDFACPIGTPIHAAADGVVTNAGRNGHASWAGNYVTIKHADGTQTLYAHMADTTVSDGQKVTGGQVIGHVGMTGRSFGPHVHFEVYPAGVTPGNVYKAINPVPWLEALGLHP